MNPRQSRIYDRVLDLDRQIEPLQNEINELAKEDLLNKTEEGWDKEGSETIQSWRTYD